MASASEVELGEARQSTTSTSDASVCLSWSRLTVSTKSKTGGTASKQLLNGVSGTIKGGLWAIMGASGSGKTTFMSSLSLRLDTYRMQQTGTLTLNGRPYDNSMLKSVSGYVMQDDLVNAHLTVFETLKYAAELRMPASTPRQERLDMVESVMDLVGIVHCRDTIVGDTRTKGISGGERKRLCIAIELLTKPRLLFLDEPTVSLLLFRPRHFDTDLCDGGMLFLERQLPIFATAVFLRFNGIILTPPNLAHPLPLLHTLTHRAVWTAPLPSHWSSCSRR